MRPVFEELSNWAGGITTSPAADSLPLGFSPRGRNTTLINIGQGSAQIGCRKGPSTGNPTPITGSPVMLGQYQLKQIDGTKIHLLVSDGGRLDKLNADLTTTAVNATAFTAGTNFPSFAAVNNMAIIANGVDLKKSNGVTTWAVGITRPAAPTATPAVGGAMSLGAWDVALTYFNSTTGQESSLSDFTTATTAGANLQINVSWLAPADPQVDYVRVHLRKQTLGPNAYIVISGLTPAPNATWNGFPVATLATVANVSDTVFGALKLVSPTVTGNNPPAVTLKFPVWHNSRLFLFDSGNAYYSNITDLTARPESFDPTNVEPINPSDGDIITGAVSAFGKLYIFKKFSMWVLDGYDPNSWTVNNVSYKYGCGSHRTICLAGGAVYWWANTSLGLLTLAGADTQPLEVGKELLKETLADTNINTLSLNISIGEVDEANDLILFALPTGGGVATRNTTIIPFNYRVKRFVADEWNPMDIASFAVVEDSTSTKTLYVGGYAGQVFKWWQSTNDGVPTGTTGGGTITAGSTSTTLVASAAAFSTVGGKLVERYVYHIPVMGEVQRRRITGNTGTVLTVTPAWDTALLVNDTFVVGGIDWQLDTPWMHSAAPFIKKRFEFLYVEASTVYNGVTVYADVYTKANLTQVIKTLVYSLANTSAVYDAATYDSSRYGVLSTLNKRKKVGVTGKSYRIRLRQLQSDKQLSGLLKVAMQASLLGSKT